MDCSLKYSLRASAMGQYTVGMAEAALKRFYFFPTQPAQFVMPRQYAAAAIFAFARSRPPLRAINFNQLPSVHSIHWSYLRSSAIMVYENEGKAIKRLTSAQPSGLCCCYIAGAHNSAPKRASIW